MKLIALILAVIGTICGGLLLGMYLGASEVVVVTTEKVTFAAVMLALNTGGIFFIAK